MILINVLILIAVRVDKIKEKLTERQLYVY